MEGQWTRAGIRPSAPVVRLETEGLAQVRGPGGKGYPHSPSPRRGPDGRARNALNRVRHGRETPVHTRPTRRPPVAAARSAHLWIAALTFTVVGACTTSPPTGGPAGHTWQTSMGSVVEERHAMAVGSAERTFLLQRPLEHVPGERLPVVIVLHGHGNGARTIASQVDSENNVAERRFIAVFPQGYGNTWNIVQCCDPAAAAFMDDFGFFDALVDYLAGRPDTDAERISLAGGSLGGITAFQYACRASDRLAGVASASGTHVTSCLPESPVPTMQIHSLTDEAIAYDGSPTWTEVLLGLDFPAVVPTMQTWAEANGECTDPPTRSEIETSDISTATLWDCGGTVTWLETLSWGGHAWPAIGDYFVADHVLDFLLGASA